jgi:SAM-dependent methyltransferase
MARLTSKTSERITPEAFKSREEYLLYLRHLFAYGFAKGTVAENSLVLEVGCGEGYGTSLLSGNQEKVIGLDVDKNAIARAREKYGSENCVFTLYDGFRIPYEDNFFDAVISFQVIEHIRDDINFVSEIHRVLRTNGVLILTTPNGALRIKRGQKPWNRFHIREYYPDELENLLKIKFSDVKILGIHGNEEVQSIENERVRQSLAIIASDPLHIRKLLPEAVKQRMIGILRGMTIWNQRIQDKMDFIEKYSLKDFYMSENNINDSLDLLVILKKST